MAQVPTSAPKPKVKVAHDVYTVLSAIALTSVAGSLAFVIYRCYQLFGTAFPGF